MSQLVIELARLLRLSYSTVEVGGDRLKEVVPFSPVLPVNKNMGASPRPLVLLLLLPFAPPPIFHASNPDCQLALSLRYQSCPSTAYTDELGVAFLVVLPDGWLEVPGVDEGGPYDRG